MLLRHYSYRAATAASTLSATLATSATSLIAVVVCCVCLLAASSPPAAAGENRWTPFGPDGSAGGFKLLAADPLTSGTVYGVGGPGDLFKSVDGGLTWIWSGRGLDGSYVGSVVIDPRHPATLYASTQIGDWRSADGGLHWTAIAGAGRDLPFLLAAAGPDVVLGIDGAGLAATTDGGASWMRLYSGAVSQAAIDPTDASRLYIVAAGDIVQSGDGGRTWSPTGQVTQGLPFHAGTTGALALAAGAPSTLYALNSSPTASNAYRSDDGGATWVQVSAAAPLASLTVDPSLPAHVFALSDTLPVLGEPAASSDGGATWAATVQGLPPAVFFGDGSSNLMGLAADAADHLAYAGSPLDGAVRWSGDAGSFTPGGPTGLPSGPVEVMKFSPLDPQTIYLATDRGFYRSADRGATWTLLGLATAGEPALADLEFDPVSPGALFGAGGPGYKGALRSVDGGRTWTDLGPGSGMPYALLRRGDALLAGGTGIARSLDGGQTWTQVLAATALGTHGGTSHTTRQVLTLIADPAAATVAYALGAERAPGAAAGTPFVFKSRDAGRTWQLLVSGLSALAIDPSRTSTLYATSGGGVVVRSTDSGRDWTPLATLPAAVLDLQVDAATTATLYAATAGAGVLRSLDGGVTWAPVNGGLALRHRLSIASLVLDAATPHRLYALPYSIRAAPQSIAGGAPPGGGAPGLFVADFPEP